MAKKKKKGKKKKEVPINDEFTEMDGATLEKTIANLKERLQDGKIKRNIIQIEKDMIHDFYSNTKNQISETEASVKNKDTAMENLESAHRVELKVYEQKVKHLEYEQTQNCDLVDDDAEKNKTTETEHHNDQEKTQRESKGNLKKEYQEADFAHINLVQTEQRNLNQKLVDINTTLKIKKEELIKQYEEKQKNLKEELELRLKVEIHEIEERKNQHINDLMANHERAFRDMKDFYQEITRENLGLIKVHRERLTDIKTQIENYQKAVDDIKTENELLQGPYKEAQKKREDLRKQTAGFEKTKLSLKNAKARKKQLKDKVMEMGKKKQELFEKYEKVSKQKEDMMVKFELAASQLMQKAEYKNAILEEKLNGHQEEHKRKETQLHELIQRSGLPPPTVDEICNKMKEQIEAKNALLRNLKYSLAHATKAYNDAIRVYEAKLIEFGIPAEELGLELLETNTSTMPAGLVAA